ncbi:hypothetical protein L1887_55266 [Cichorium endivia]|nr:hypothetical protein L1887_55266 [Cichorium endivia]
MRCSSRGCRLRYRWQWSVRYGAEAGKAGWRGAPDCWNRRRQLAVRAMARDDVSNAASEEKKKKRRQTHGDALVQVRGGASPCSSPQSNNASSRPPNLGIRKRRRAVIDLALRPPPLCNFQPSSPPSRSC